MTTTEIGMVYGDAELHGVKPSLAGARAVCGAGLIITRVPGRFDPDHERACPRCAEQLADATTADPGVRG